MKPIMKSVTSIFTCSLLLWASNFGSLQLNAIARTPADRNIPIVSIDRLPIEAKQTIETIERGGPFPYSKDGTIFGNRERRLPMAPRGTYREYTVKTPGATNRGARRIITAPQRVYYYTGNHYRSFSQVEK
jgi:ribonuclease T1